MRFVNLHGMNVHCIVLFPYPFVPEPFIFLYIIMIIIIATIIARAPKFGGNSTQCTVNSKMRTSAKR